MAQNMELQERYSALVEAKLRKTSVFAGLYNNRYEGNPKAGAVKVPVRADATASAYDIAQGVQITAPTTTYQTIVLDNDYAVNELIDGYVAAAVPDGLVADRLDSAGYALGKKIDDLLVADLVANGTAASTTATKVYDQIIDTIAEAKTVGVDPNSIWVAVAPTCYAELLKSSIFETAATLQEVRVGQIGALGGVPVVETNNLTGKQFIVGNSDFCHFVDEFIVPVSVNDLSDGVHIGASAVQGRNIFGFKLSKANTVFTK